MLPSIKQYSMHHLSNKFFALIAFLSSFAFVTSAFAEDLYVAQVAAGSANGTSASNAYAVTFFNTSSNWGTGTGKISPGDTVRLVGTISTTLTVQGSGSSGSPITIVFEPGAKLSKPAWGVDTGAAVNANGKHYITLDGGANGIIECTANGDGLANAIPATGVFIRSCTNWEIKKLTIRNIYVHIYNTNNVVPGYSTQCIKASNSSNLSIHDNNLNNAYVALYAYTESNVALSNLNIFKNSISASSTDIIASLGAPNSSIDSINIYDNDITMGTNWFDTPNNNHIDGMHIWTSENGDITNLNIFNNFIHGDPTTHCTGFIYLENRIVSSRIYNNLFVGNNNHPAEGYINFNLSGTANAYVFNNTIVGLGSSSAGGNAIAFDPSRPGTTGHVKNNLIINCYVGIYDAFASVTWDNDYNLFYNCGNIGRLAGFKSSLSSWQSGAGTDANSIVANPLLTATYTIPLNSPASPMGANLSSYFTTDKAGNPRPATGAWSVGCYAAGASANPIVLAPSSASIAIAVK